MSKETEAIKERLDMVALVSEYVSLKQAGQSFKGLCPFHSEKSPSFIVSPARGTWHCFGCSEGGDAFTFIQKIEGLDFPSTLKMLAERTGVVLEVRRADPQATNRRQRLFDLMQEAATFYAGLLLQHKAGAQAKAYLLGRGVKEETMKLFQIGYAPMQWETLQQRLLKKGFTLEEMIATGMVGENQRGQHYDRFRGRIMFPVQDTQGRIVAFGGRIVPWHETGNEGKYVNSPETQLYEKRRVVYNLNRAKNALRGNQPCVVVEGYMDVVMLVQTGLQHVVATSGTAFTPEHIGQLARFTKQLYFAFDADSAGWKATVSATNTALAAGLDVSTVVLPDDKDPADVALEEPDKVADYFSRTHSLVQVLLSQFKQASQLATQQQQLEALLPLVKVTQNPIMQGRMVQEIATVLHVPEERVFALLAAQVMPVVAAQVPALEVAEDKPNSSQALAEWQLLGILLAERATRAEVFPRLKDELFIDASSQALYNSLNHLMQTNQSFADQPASTVIQTLPEGVISFAEAVLAKGEEMLALTSHTPLQEANMLTKALQRRALTSRLNVLQQQLGLTDEAGRNEALRQFQVLTEELGVINNQ